MSKMKFSDDQEKAIKALDENYLISAGAGSGKTAVLTERIYRLAKKDQSLDHFLVVTFTELAAGEMKNRVRQKLLDDIETQHLASEVDNAHIETFDAFSFYLAKKYFYELDISKDVSIVDNTILSIQRRKILDEYIEDLYLNNDKELFEITDKYVVKDLSIIKNYIIDILEKSDKKADNFAFMNHLYNDFFNQETIDKAINDFVKETHSNLEFLKEKAYELEDANDADQIINFFDNLLLINNYDELYRTLTDKELGKFPPKDRKVQTSDKDYRDKIADFYNKKIKPNKDFNFGLTEDIVRQYNEVKPYAKKIIEIAIEVEHRLDKFKKERNAYSFGDISRFVLRLLNNEEIRKEISDQFDYIMIDEYQDTNDIQETVISAISKNNVYMVGDVKQSIYRFRGADCHIFQEKYEKYKKGIGGKEIDLNTSYRSRKEVVDFVNELFSQLMVKSINAIDYSNGHHFGFGRTEYEVNKPKCNYLPEVYNYTYDKAEDALKAEIDIIIKDILYKIKNQYQVYDNELKRSRDAEYKDFAIIIDRGTSFGEYRRAFTEANIPVKVESKETLFKSDVAIVTRNLVKMLYYSLKNEYEGEYKHAFMSVARSFLLEYKDDYLYEIFKDKSYLKEEFAQKIELIKESLRYAPIEKVLLTLYEEFDIYASISKITQYYPNAHKLEFLLKISKMMDSLNYSLEDFVIYFDDLNKLEKDIDYSDSDSRDNSVTLINIHKSKGLEYSVIYYPGLTKQFNNTEIKTSYLASEKYGAIIPSTIEEASSLFIHLIKEELKTSDFEEKLRLLYVAITRAKEKIIFVNGNKPSKILFYKPNNAKNMQEILSITNVLTKYDAPYPIDNIVVTGKEIEKQVTKVVLKKVNVPANPVVHTRASKEVDEDAIAVTLDFGSELHAYLERMDLETKSTDYVSNRQMKKYVYNVINSKLFDGITNEQVRHEFRFYDEESNIQGYIDALIIKDDEIDIVDFKLKNIMDEEYDRQLRIYKSYLVKHTDLPVKMYLLAAITGEIREVKDE